MKELGLGASGERKHEIEVIGPILNRSIVNELALNRTVVEIEKYESNDNNQRGSVVTTEKKLI